MIYYLALVFFILIDHVHGQEPFTVSEGFVQSDEGKLFYRIVGKGDPIILIHGGPGLDHSYFLPALDALADRHSVIFYDQRGSGKSECVVNCETINMERFVNDLEKLRSALKLDKVSIIGHSWGSLVAIEYALMFPQYVKSLVLLHAFPPTNKGLEKYYENLEQKLKPVADQLGKIELSNEFKKGSFEAVQNYLDIIFKKYFFDENKVLLLNSRLCQSTAANVFRIGDLLDSDYLADYNLEERVTNLSLPTLIIHGDNDPVPQKYALRWHQAIKNSQFQLVKSSGHFSFIEQPATFFRLVDDFLSLDHK
ncbi:MAG: alpha/beta fold hydrolase [Parachlamydiaceae bacterium]